jgi:hypothetical protein
MYRSCIFCSAPLGSNDSIERFPVGRSLAFDAAKGRLWAVCPRCARWNLAPIEERWEAIEDAERLFHDTRQRVQSENIGLASLRNGTRLIRVGEALPGELAAWRYGRMALRRYLARRATERIGRGLGVGVGVGVPAAMAVSMAAGLTGAAIALSLAGMVILIGGQIPGRERFRPLLAGTGVPVDVGSLRAARFALTSRSEVSVALAGFGEDDAPLLDGEFRGGWLVPSAEYARMLLLRGMVQLNAAGVAEHSVGTAMDLVMAHGSGEEFLRRAAVDRARLADGSVYLRVRSARMLAVEMAVHDQLERDALRGELAALKAAWRHAEEIAGIADRLPGLPAPEPPRLSAES